ncbi:MAG: hypothetical protein Q8K69_02400 [Bacteroidota bacterium]|nr:hypothetical protein [Bacteroidota bacterium]
MKLSIITGYSIIGNSFSNIPIAILYKRDGGQTYFGTDNLLSFLFPSFQIFQVYHSAPVSTFSQGK